ncbi:Uma2 family endonuclease [Pannus brasiliensis CCIBt3594]|uniref:Uma2 family endonuclease n=1 Tax=Pannus brasiliensis CCIBt3594 TaxID=1427578 RepID=A0AAW9QUJ6_9CHRO
MISIDSPPEIVYPSSDGEPLAESYSHLYAILTTLEVLKQYLSDRMATVLADQFLYYSQGFPKLRVAPDVMVIFDVERGGRDNYKLWEEKQIPKVIFEMTSAGTRNQDLEFKKNLYEQLGVEEYWLFDPRGEWIPEKLIGYRLDRERYEPITDGCSQPLQLRLAVDGELIAFYRQETGEKLLIPDELATALREESIARQTAELQLQQTESELQETQQRLSEAEALLQRYRQQFGELPPS